MLAKLLLPALAAATIAAAPARASDVSFSYSPTELVDASGVDSLYARLAFRAEAACSSIGPRGIWRRKAQSECADALLTDFVDRIGDSSLIAAHEQAHDRWLAIRN